MQHANNYSCWQNIFTSTHTGEIKIPFEHSNNCLHKILFAPSLSYILDLTRKLADKGIQSLLCCTNVRLGLDRNKLFFGLGFLDKTPGMYVLPESALQTSQIAMSACSKSKLQEAKLWNRCLAHMNMNYLTSLQKHADGVPKRQKTGNVCRACKMEKAHKLPFPRYFNHAAAADELLHPDMMGWLELYFSDKCKYVCTFIDDHFR